MPRLTLRTLLAYIDDTLDPLEAHSLGKKVAESDEARELVDRIKKVTRRRGLAAPASDDEEAAGDPNTVAEYLDNALDSDTLRQVEETCLESDLHLAEVAACHQILTLVLTEPVRVAPRAHKRMYELMKAPAAVPNRKPSKTLPVSASAPPDAVAADTDDADAALLFGMKRYSATTWAARFALFGAAAVLLLLLTGAVLKVVWHSDPPRAPEVAAARPASPPPAPTPPAPKDKEPDPLPLKKEPDAAVPPMPEPRMVDPGDAAVAPIPLPAPPGPKVGGQPGVVPPASDVRGPVGRLDTTRAIVMASGPAIGAGNWLRQPPKRTDDPPGGDVHSTDTLMALPGHKADVILGPINKPTVEVHLWGNVPEQLPYRAFESKVTFHQPPEGFDAEITLHAGRIYLRNLKAVVEKKPVLAKVRVRLANTTEVWDLSLTDESNDVFVELISWFKPGTPYAREGGEDPRREARVAVLRGPVVFFVAPNRPKNDRIEPGTQLRWDSKVGELVAPVPIPNQPEVAREVGADPKGKETPVRRVLNEMADAVNAGTEVRTVLRGRLGAPDHLTARLAVYSWVALADSTEAGCETFKELTDRLNPELAWPVRQAFVTAFVQWVAREKGNTALFRAYLTKRVPEKQVDAILEMLRGFLTPTAPEHEQLDKLLPRINGVKAAEFEFQEPALLMHDIAMWNLVVADKGAWIPPPVVNLPTDWGRRIKEIKGRPAPK